MEIRSNPKTLLTCWKCDGEGFLIYGLKSCDDCQGTGFYTEPHKDYPFHGYGQQTETKVTL